MKIRIKKINIKNYRGMRNFSADLDSDILEISGENGTGKSSIFDAFCWCLFGKDAKGRSDSGTGDNNIKTVDLDGEIIHNIEHSVEVYLSDDTNTVVFQRKLEEEWKKPRGVAEKKFNGNIIHYYVNFSETKAADFTKYVNDIIHEDVFKSITDPYFFTSQDWKKQREMLIDMCGDVDAQEIANKSQQFSELLDRINGSSIETYRQQMVGIKKKIKEEMETIPSKIEGINSVMPVLCITRDEVLKEEKEKRKQLSEIQKAASDVNAAFELENRKVIEENRTLINIHSKIESIRDEIAADKASFERQINKDVADKKAKISSIEEEIERRRQSHERDKNNVLSEIEQFRKTAERYEKQRQDKMLEYRNAKCRCYNSDSICPITSLKCNDAALSSFNQANKDNFEKNKEQELVRIVEEGTAIKDHIAEIGCQISTLEENLKAEDLNASNSEMELSKKLSELRANEGEISTNIKKVYKVSPELESRLNELEKAEKEQVEKIGELGNAVKSNTIDLELEKVQEELSEIMKKNTIMEQVEKSKEQICALEQREKELGTQLSKIEQEEQLCVDFSQTYMEALENKINKHFNLIKFRMFEKTINGEDKPTCVALVNGVRFQFANSAGQINAGIEIINALCKYYDVSAPIFVDNAERVTKLNESESQIIKLNVSMDKTLTVKKLNKQN